MRVPALLRAIVSDTDRRNSRRCASSSSCVPRSTMRPSRRTTIWSAWRTVETRCEIKMVVRPLHDSLRRRRMRSSVRVSTLESESSRMRMRGSRTTARASAVRCFCPPERVMPRSPTMVSYLAGKPSISAAMLAISAAADDAVRRTSGRRRRRYFRAMVSLNR